MNLETKDKATMPKTCKLCGGPHETKVYGTPFAETSQTICPHCGWKEGTK
jgi:hypothetical protein